MRRRIDPGTVRSESPVVSAIVAWEGHAAPPPHAYDNSAVYTAKSVCVSARRGPHMRSTHSGTIANLVRVETVSWSTICNSFLPKNRGGGG